MNSRILSLIGLGAVGVAERLRQEVNAGKHSRRGSNLPEGRAGRKQEQARKKRRKSQKASRRRNRRK